MLSSGDSTRELTTDAMVTRIRPTQDQANQISQHYHQQAALTGFSGLQIKRDDVKSGKETHWGCLVEKGGGLDMIKIHVYIYEVIKDILLTTMTNDRERSHHGGHQQLAP